VTITGPTITTLAPQQQWERCPKCQTGEHFSMAARRECDYCAHTGMTPVLICRSCREPIKLFDQCCRNHDEEVLHAECGTPLQRDAMNERIKQACLKGAV
jgi:hypothetical protein